jgi:hypothetical protein
MLLTSNSALVMMMMVVVVVVPYVLADEHYFVKGRVVDGREIDLFLTFSVISRLLGYAVNWVPADSVSEHPIFEAVERL